MDIYLKVMAGVLIAAFLNILLAKQGKDVSMLLITVACCMVAVTAISYLQPVLRFCDRLIQTGRFNNNLLENLLKVTGIGIISQIVELICVDTGNQSLGKVLQILTVSVILCISVPILEEMLQLIERILGEV